MSEDWRAPLADALSRLKRERPDVGAVDVFAVSLNGATHGKRVPLFHVERLVADGPGAIRFQLSLAGLDAFGADVPESGIAMEIGDPDGGFVPIPATLQALPDSRVARLQGMLAPVDAGGEAGGGAAGGAGELSALDPRAALQRVVRRVEESGFLPVMALEVEFYLIDAKAAAPAPDPVTGARLDRLQMMDLDTLATFEPVLERVATAAEAIGLPVETALAEFGAGQFEVNLGHTDALAAADNLIALKWLLRRAARAEGLDVTFMAKPFGGWSGSGLHAHLSLTGRDGRNAFDEPADGAPCGPTLSSAVAGLTDSAADAFLVFAPHLNSYRRFYPGSYAPLAATWGLDNRGAAVRLPATSGKGARLEHRIAGADANPYLLAAAVIAGALDGMGRGASPGPPATTETLDGAAFPATFEEATQRFAASPFAAANFGEPLVRVFAAMKRQEAAELRKRVSDVELALYLRTV